MLIYEKASEANMDLLVKMRSEVLRAANGLNENEDMSLVEQQTREYYGEAVKKWNECHISDIR